MPRVLIWDLSTRVLHLAFAGSLTAALALGFGLDDEHPLFAYHMLAGLFAAGALALRALLGLAGARHMRFRDWPMGPVAMMRHLRALFGAERAADFPGHNPVAAWVMAAMYLVAAGLLWTGLDGGEDVHEAMAWMLIALVGAHLAGLALHSILKRENLALAMVGLDEIRRG